MVSPVGEVFSFQTRDLQITGERWDAADTGRPVVILLHGGGQTRHSWKRTAVRLNAAGWGVVALDARGHGDSAWHPQQDYSLDGFAGDLLTFASTLELPPVLVGASLGGMTGLLVAGEHAGAASALVLVDVVVDVEREGTQRIRRFMTGHSDGFGSLEDVADAIAAYNPHRPRPKDPSGLRKNVRQRDDGRWYWHWDPAFMIRIDDEPSRRVDPERLRAAARRLTIPVLLVRGLNSDVVSDEGMARMLELVPQAQVVEVGAAGHMIAGDDNDVFTQHLEEFLDGVQALREPVSSRRRQRFSAPPASS